MICGYRINVSWYEDTKVMRFSLIYRRRKVHGSRADYLSTEYSQLRYKNQVPIIVIHVPSNRIRVLIVRIQTYQDSWYNVPDSWAHGPRGKDTAKWCNTCPKDFFAHFWNKSDKYHSTWTGLLYLNFFASKTILYIEICQLLAIIGKLLS
jgi:hypothetical protein